MYIPYVLVDVDMIYMSVYYFLYQAWRALECKNLGKRSFKVTIFGRWELAVADNVYIRNRNGSNIGAQTYHTCQYSYLYR